MSIRIAAAGLAAASLAGLTACGGGGGGPAAPPQTYSVGVTVSGLSGSGLTLSDNGSDALTVSGNGSATFAKAVAAGSGYSVAVTTQPSSPTQTCTVANGSGTVGSANVSNVTVTCTTNTYPLNATVTGLTGSGLILQDNLGDTVPVTSSGTASFATQVPSGGSYSVKVVSQPSNPLQMCTVANGSGAVTNAAITAPVTCFAPEPQSVATVNFGDSSLSFFALDPVTGQPRARGQYGFGPTFTVTAIAGDGQGRFLYVLNGASGSISGFQTTVATNTIAPIPGGPFAAGTNPSTLTAHPSAKTIYAVNGGSNDISEYAINQTTGALTALTGSPVKAGTTPRQLTIDAHGQFAYITNSGSNDVYSYSIDPSTGALTEIPNSRVATGTQPFDLLFDPTGKFAYVANTGSANVSAYTVDVKTGILTPVPGSPFTTNGAPGDVTSFNGGREPLLLHPNGKLLFVRSTVAKAISVFTIDSSTGALTAAPGSPYTVGDGAVWQTLDPTGQFLYVANRGTTPTASGSISVFKVNTTTGALAEAPGSPFQLTGGPAMVSVEPSGHFLYASSSATDLLYGFKIDQTSGALTPLDSGAQVMTGDYPAIVLADPPIPNPGTVTFKSKFAYVANSDGTVSAYSIDATSGALTLAGTAPSAGTGIIALAAAPGRNLLYAANSSTNNLTLFDIDPATGKITARNTMIGLLGPPSILLTDKGAENAYVVTGGTGNTIAYPIDPATQLFNAGGGVQMQPTALAVADSTRFAFGLRNGVVESYRILPGGISTPSNNPPPAAAATALAVHPSGQFVYVAVSGTPGSVQTYTVATVSFQAGTLTAAGSPVQVGTTPSSVVAEPTGHFLYVADGAANNISGFSIDQGSGALTPLAGAPVSTGNHPISASVDESGKYLYVLSDVDHSVSLYAIDPSTGALSAIGTPIATGPSPKALLLTSDVTYP